MKEFPENDIQIINGRYGPYIKHAGGNYKIGKGTKAAETLTLEDCLAIVNNTQATNSRKTATRTRKKTK